MARSALRADGHAERDAEIRRYLEESLRRLDANEPAPPLTAEKFLAQTRLPDE